jgi:hypothetical protein
MTIYTKPIALGRKKYLAMALPLLMAAQTHSIQFKMGEVTTSLDTQLSLGSSWRAEDADQTKVGPGNVDSTDDDGNRNYAKGDAFSQIFKGSHDLHIKYENMGVFLRGKYWYDSAIENNSVDYGHGPTTSVTSAADQNLATGTLGSALTYNNNEKLDDSGFDDLSKGSGVTLLDAFIYGQFDIGEMPIDVRLGKQVVSWGESTFIIGGINAINPADLSAFRRPGAEIKEGLLPVGMAYANLGITDNLSAEAFYQYEYQNTISDACGTFFSTSDIAAEGCNSLSVSGGILSISRDQSFADEPADDNQFGLAFRYYAEDIETEFGFYAMNIHNRVPIYNVVVGQDNDAASFGELAGVVAAGVNAALPLIEAGTLAFFQTIPGLETLTAANLPFFPANVQSDYADAVAGEVAAQNAAGIAAGLGGVILAGRVQAANYATSYPEDNQLFGLSFSTNIDGIAVSGEVSHKVDSPVQINGPLLTNAVLARGLGTDNAGQIAAYTEIFGSPATGDLIQGYREFDITQVQVTLISTINNIVGASQVAVVGEVGGQFIHDFDDVLRYGRASFYGNATFDDTEDLDGFATESSFGYRARVSATYNNVFAGIDVTPTISWAHDVSGTSAGPGGPFLEGNQTLGLSVKANFLERYSANLAYTAYEGGDYSITGDRDYVSASVDVQF